MKFIDEVTITVESGHGGHGCVSFRREKFIPKGGPDGGNGGKGGDIVFVASAKRRTLLPFRYKRIYKAPNGGAGAGVMKSGKNGDDLVIEVPVGTIIKNKETGAVIKDLSLEDERFVVAKGGRGGKGNAHFKSSTYRAPRFAQDGEPSEFFELQLELKLLADVGIIGLPNAGKSTLITAISAARPKIADYPFTTLVPSLGVVNTTWTEPFVVADIPGLIEGAHAGVGLGTRFLRHVERTKVLVHLLDASGIDEESPLKDYDMINRELALYKPELAAKDQLVVLNKMDLTDTEEKARIFEKALGREVMRISAAGHMGLDDLIRKLAVLLNLEDRDTYDDYDADDEV